MTVCVFYLIFSHYYSQKYTLALILISQRFMENKSGAVAVSRWRFGRGGPQTGYFLE